MSCTRAATVKRSERTRRSLGFEPLEERCLLARSPNLLVVDYTTPGDVLPLADGGLCPLRPLPISS